MRLCSSHKVDDEQVKKTVDDGISDGGADREGDMIDENYSRKVDDVDDGVDAKRGNSDEKRNYRENRKSRIT